MAFSRLSHYIEAMSAEQDISADPKIGPNGKEPGYDEWLEDKVRKAISEADADPSNRMTLDQVRKKFDLDP